MMITSIFMRRLFRLISYDLSVFLCLSIVRFRTFTFTDDYGSGGEVWCEGSESYNSFAATSTLFYSFSIFA